MSSKTGRAAHLAMLALPLPGLDGIPTPGLCAAAALCQGPAAGCPAALHSVEGMTEMWLQLCSPSLCAAQNGLKTTWFWDYFLLLCCLMPEENVWLKVIFSYFAVHTFFTMCKARFEAVASVTPPRLSFLISGGQCKLYSAPKAILRWQTFETSATVFWECSYKLSVCFLILSLRNINNVISFNLDFTSSKAFLLSKSQTNETCTMSGLQKLSSYSPV